MDLNYYQESAHKATEENSIESSSVEGILGDILWLLSEIATAHKIKLNDVAKFNLKRLRLSKQ